LDGVGKINGGLSWIGIACLVVVVISVTIDVTGRFLFRTGWGLAFELSLSSMVMMVWVAGAYTLREKRHIVISILSDRLSPKARARLEVIVYTLGGLICGIFTKSAWLLFEWSLSIREVTVVSKLPLPILKFFIVIGFVLLSLQFFGLARDSWRELQSLSQAPKGEKGGGTS
jgi:TRAP-type C4-dicarboxylate transport system permease small subunit